MNRRARNNKKGLYQRQRDLYLVRFPAESRFCPQSTPVFSVFFALASVVALFSYSLGSRCTQLPLQRVSSPPFTVTGESLARRRAYYITVLVNSK